MRTWCVKHRDGWCVSRGQSGSKEAVRRREASFQVRTLCGYVTLPFGVEFREPTCGECVAALKKKRQGKRR